MKAEAFVYNNWTVIVINDGERVIAERHGTTMNAIDHLFYMVPSFYSVTVINHMG